MGVKGGLLYLSLAFTSVSNTHIFLWCTSSRLGVRSLSTHYIIIMIKKPWQLLLVWWPLLVDLFVVVDGFQGTGRLLLTTTSVSRTFTPTCRHRRRRRRRHANQHVAALASSPSSDNDHYQQVKEDDRGEESLMIVSTPVVRPLSQDGRSKLEAYILLQAALIGLTGGAAVALFTEGIEATRHVLYGLDFAYVFLPLIPAAGGLVVGMLASFGSFPPGLSGSIREVDNDARRAVSGSILKAPAHPFGFLRKTAASIITLGSGSSLGPEGPSVEVGMSCGRIIMKAFPPLEYLQQPMSSPRIRNADEAELVQRGRLLLSCGAAAGVSAGFNAPIAGVFFCLEIVESALAQVELSQQELNPRQKGPLSITAILVASVAAALACRAISGEEMVLTLSKDFAFSTPLMELPLYMLLGATCGVVAVVFSCLAKVSKSWFEGNVGPPNVRQTMQGIPYVFRPALGGLICGVLGLVYPQILFFGYETLNALLHSLLEDSFGFILSLLVVKMVATALAAGSGLVGGTFAPSLFLGAMTGTAFYQVAAPISLLLLTSNSDGGAAGWEMAGGPVYAMVGAASVLAALFRAPLTASLLLFELVRDYNVILPIMASAGLASVVADWIETTVEQEQVEELRRDRDAVSWGDLADASVSVAVTKEQVTDAQEVAVAVVAGADVTAASSSE